MEQNKKSSMFIEIFEPEATQCDFTPAGSAADALCRKVETADLMEKALGCTHEEAMKGLAPTPPPAPTSVRATFHSSLDEFISALAKRVDDAVEKAPSRARVIRAIIDQARNKPELKLIRNSEGWDRLAYSCLTFVTRAVITEGK